MENRKDLLNRSSSSWTWRTRNEEFEEEDVWGVLKEREYSITPPSKLEEPSSYITRRSLPTATRMIPKFKQIQEPKIIQQSAPVQIPDWSKIYGSSSKNNSGFWLDPDSDGDENGRWGSDDEFHDEEEEEDEEDEEDGDGDGGMVPPHEYIANKFAKNQTWSFSVCEGAGRTLKGRDLSRVRNAVLSKTGFLESKFDN